MTAIETREPAGTPRTAQTAGSRTTPRIVAESILDVASGIGAAVLVVLAVPASVDNLAPVIAALCVASMLLRTDNLTRKRGRE